MCLAVTDTLHMGALVLLPLGHFYDITALRGKIKFPKALAWSLNIGLSFHNLLFSPLHSVKCSSQDVKSFGSTKESEKLLALPAPPLRKSWWRGGHGRARKSCPVDSRQWVSGTPEQSQGGESTSREIINSPVWCKGSCVLLWLNIIIPLSSKLWRTLLYEAVYNIGSGKLSEVCTKGLIG